MSVRKAAALIASLFFIFAVTNALADVSGRAIGVTDGDTFKVIVSTASNTKYASLVLMRPNEASHSKRLQLHLLRLIAGKQVKIESNKKDRYGCVLGKVIFKGVDVNLEQVKAGYAWWYEYYAKQQPIADRKSYSKAEKAARKKRLGLWSDQNPINPYDWRRAH